ncbi:hypothetical protein [Streptomyces sp. NPDC001568]|uniref:hypothetical protein n=1 Tax=Streptomyces sp. NPDC001568 TaxID=3364588 RepID=UPI0036B92163
MPRSTGMITQLRDVLDHAPAIRDGMPYSLFESVAGVADLASSTQVAASIPDFGVLAG